MMHGLFTHRLMAPAALGAAATATVLTLTACSPSPPHPARTHGATTAARPAANTAGTPSPGTGGHPAGSSQGQLGSALAVSDSNGTQLEVTLTKIIDPADGASQYSNPASGKHFVGVELHVQNTAAGTYQNNANNETTITVSGGKTLHADYNPIAGCGNFDNGQIKLKSHAASTGCVTFQVPASQKVIQVSYGNTVFPGTAAEWRIS